jgi:hypothetical protein
VNPSDQRFTDRLFQRIASLEKQMQQIKTAQPVGAQSVSFIDSIENSFAVPVGANSMWWRDLRFYGITGVLGLTGFVSELGLRFYIDNDNNENYRLPPGPSLTSGQLKCHAASWQDHHEGVVGEKWYHIPLINGDSAAHTFYCHFILTLPKGALSS